MRTTTKSIDKTIAIVALLLLSATIVTLAYYIDNKAKVSTHQTCIKCNHWFTIGTGKAVIVVHGYATETNMYCSIDAPIYDKIVAGGEISYWHNGYNWTNLEKYFIYNPVSPWQEVTKEGKLFSELREQELNKEIEILKLLLSPIKFITNTN